MNESAQRTRESRPTPVHPYLEALRAIPKGQTRSFAEVAALAGRPQAARAAGRAISGCPTDSKLPWHRVVSASGAFSIDDRRADEQYERLAAEGARPQIGESVERWARRVKAAYVGTWRGRRYARADDARVIGFDPEFVERFGAETEARARGFTPFEDEDPRRAGNSRARRPERASPQVPARTRA